jgi:hypothetical protein
MASAKQHTAVPKNRAKNHLFNTTTLIDCMAAIPCAGGTRAKLFMTKFEKAKKIPATRPEPGAATNVTRQIGLLIGLKCGRTFERRFHRANRNPR